MVRCFVLAMLIFSICASAFGAGASVTLDGKSIVVPTMESKGKVYVDAVALAKLLGGKATYNAATHKLVITTGGATSGSGSGGVDQLVGDAGELSKIYSLRKSNPMHFRLTSAEFTVSSVKIGDRLYMPAANEKLLVLHFTVQNPQKDLLLARNDSLKFTAVDAMNVNHEGENAWGDQQTQGSCDMMLKPAQKVDVYSVIRVPAKGEVPKLMVLPGGNDGPVVRFDLRGKVTPLKSPIADPSDPTGSTALETVPAVPGDAYPIGNFDITVEKSDYATGALDGKTPAKGGRFLVVSLRMKNAAPTERLLRHDMIRPELTSTDGELLKYKGMLFGTSDRSIAQQTPGGQEMAVRIYFDVPKGATPKTLTIKSNDSRTFEYEVK